MNRHLAATDWLRRLAWQELFGVALLAGVGFAVASFGDRLTFWPALALGCLFTLTLSILFRRGWLTVLGPVAVHEIVHTTRRSHFVLYRLYAYFIVIVLTLFYCVWTLASNQGSGVINIRAKEMAEFAAGFVLTFLGLQLLMLAVLTPAYTAGVLAEEKERGTLEFLLATDLRNREIVLSKVTARLGNLLLTLLTGVPVVCFLQFLGGVDPMLVLAGFVATAATMLGMAGLGILNSVYCRKPRNAIVLTFLEAAAYLVFAYAVPQFVIGTGYLGTPAIGTLTVGDLLLSVDAGSPISLLTEVVRSQSSPTRMARLLPGLIRNYVLFHGALALVCVAWASLRLRAVFRKQVYEQDSRGKRGRRRRLLGVGPWPMVWKEVVAEPGLRLAWFGRLVVTVLVVGSFLPLVTELMNPGRVPSGRFVGLWARIIGGLVACLLLLRVTVHASTALTGERERQTWDGLLTTPLSAGQILVGKWLGSLASVRWGWLWLAIIWGLGVAADLRPAALALMVAAWWIYAAVLSAIGLWFSLRCPTSLRATALTLLVAFGLGASYILSLPLMVAWPRWQEPGAFVTFLNHLQVGLSPLLSLSWLLAFDANGAYASHGWELPMALLGLACWTVGGIILWCVLLRSFRAHTGREAVRRPEPGGAMVSPEPLIDAAR